MLGYFSEIGVGKNADTVIKHAATCLHVQQARRFMAARIG
jgi:hypothetical protein